MDERIADRQARWKWRLALGAGVVAVVALPMLATLSRGNATTAAAHQVVRTEHSLRVTSRASLVPDRRMLLTSAAAGTVVALHGQPGQRVRAGDLVLELEGSELAAEIAQLEFDASVQRASLREIELAKIEDLQQKRAMLREAEGQFRLLKAQREAEQQLFARGVISELQLNKTHLEAELAGEKIETARDSLSSADKIGKARWEAASHKLESIEARLHQRREELGALSVRAPIDGKLEELSVKLGQHVLRGAALGSVASESIKASLEILEIDAPQVAPGQRVRLRAVGGTAVAFIESVSGVARDGRVEALARLDAGLEPWMRPNMSVDAEVLVRTVPDALVVDGPPGLGGRWLSVEVERVGRNKAESVRLRLSGYAEGRYLIEEGNVGQGDRVLFRGLEHG